MDQTFKHMRLLLVDDEEPVLRSISRALRHEEYSIEVATNAFEALEILNRKEIHVILTDFKMPKESGFTLLEKVKEQWPSVIRIMLTAYTNSTLLIDAINRGLLFRFIDKPWKSNQLITLVREAMNHHIRQQKVVASHQLQSKIIHELEELVSRDAIEKKTDEL